MDCLTYTANEAACLLGISRTTAYECVRSGEIPSLTLGRRVLISRVALERMLDGAPSPPRRRRTRRHDDHTTTAKLRTRYAPCSAWLQCRDAAVSFVGHVPQRVDIGRRVHRHEREVTVLVP